MDLSTLLVWMIIGLAVVLALGPLASSLGRSSAVMGSLFVPYDRSLGWPTGVQESDEPWAWRVDPPSTAPPVEPVARGPVRRARH
jgi:hypothetical protein